MSILRTSFVVFCVVCCFLVFVPSISAQIGTGGRVFAAAPCWNGPFWYAWHFDAGKKVVLPVVYPLFPPLQRANYLTPIPGVAVLGNVAGVAPCVIVPPPFPIVIPGNFSYLYGTGF